LGGLRTRRSDGHFGGVYLNQFILGRGKVYRAGVHVNVHATAIHVNQFDLGFPSESNFGPARPQAQPTFCSGRKTLAIENRQASESNGFV
jgi:hypothetical protein